MGSQGLAPNLGMDWPNLNTLQAVATGQLPPTISIFDRGGIKNTVRNVFLTPVLPEDLGTTGAVLTINSTDLPVAGTVVLTADLTKLPLIYDALFFVTGIPGRQKIAEAINTGSTLDALLDDLVAAINGLPQVSAVRSGTDTITVTNTGAAFLQVKAGVINVGGFTQEIYRQKRELQITLWTQTPHDRERYGTVLENLFANLEVNFGLILADNQSWARLLIEDDMVWKDSQLQDLYRRDFIISLDYPVLAFLPAWIVESIEDIVTPE